METKCCAALEDALGSRRPLIYQTDNGAFMISVSYLLPEENFGLNELGFLDQEMRFCPFCGTNL